MEQIQKDQLERFLILHNEHVKENHYLLQLTRESFLELYGNSLEEDQLAIFIDKAKGYDQGYIFAQKMDTKYQIKELYVRPAFRSLNKYLQLMNAIKPFCGKRTKVHFCGRREDSIILRVMSRFHFNLRSSQVEMERPLEAPFQINPRLSVKKFYQMDDAQGLHQFVNRLLEGRQGYGYQEIADMILYGDDLKLLFFYQGQPVGFTISYINEARNRQENRQVLYIEEVAINEKYRRHGFGKEIFYYLMNRGIAHGMKVARLHVYRDNHVARKLYKGLGFKETEVIGYWEGSF